MKDLAQQLAYYQTRYGDWRELFRYLDRVDKVTKADIRRVSPTRSSRTTNRTVGIIQTQTASSQPGPPTREQRSGTAMSAIEEHCSSKRTS